MLSPRTVYELLVVRTSSTSTRAIPFFNYVKQLQIIPVDNVMETTYTKDKIQLLSYFTPKFTDYFVNVQELNVGMLSLGAHKFYGPKGVGALYIRKGTPLISAQTGGSQEFSHRPGTHNIPYIVGLAEALRLIEAERDQNKARLLPMRDFIIGSVLEAIPESMLTGHPELRLPNHASFVFKNIDGNRLLMFLDIAGYGCSSGSACTTGDPKPSEILLSLGLSDEWALGSLRVTLGKTTSSSDVNAFLRALPEIISHMRGMG